MRARPREMAASSAGGHSGPASVRVGLLRSRGKRVDIIISLRAGATPWRCFILALLALRLYCGSRCTPCESHQRHLLTALVLVAQEEARRSRPHLLGSTIRDGGGHTLGSTI
jgi:hypothetical protein